MAAEVVAYTDPSCPHCLQLKQYLSRRGIPFEDRDVSSDDRAAEEFRRMDPPGVPVVRVGSDIVIGFDPDRLDEVLEANGVVAQ